MFVHGVIPKRALVFPSKNHKLQNNGFRNFVMTFGHPCVQVDGVNYHVLRNGTFFPFIKYHISKRPYEDLRVEDIFYKLLKVLNFGFPTMMYGLAGLLMAKHTEGVMVEGKAITIYF